MHSTNLEVKPQDEPEGAEMYPIYVDLAARAGVHARGTMGAHPSLPVKFKQRFSGALSVHEDLPRFPLCVSGMSASQLSRLLK